MFIRPGNVDIRLPFIDSIIFTRIWGLLFMESHTRPRPSTGVTLIELLVVIAIIAVLIRLLFACYPAGSVGGGADKLHEQSAADRTRHAQLSLEP